MVFSPYDCYQVELPAAFGAPSGEFQLGSVTSSVPSGEFCTGIVQSLGTADAVFRLAPYLGNGSRAGFCIGEVSTPGTYFEAGLPGIFFTVRVFSRI